MPAARETLTSLAVPAERTRFYSRLRTLRMAHGLIEFVRDLRRLTGAAPATLVFDQVEHADPTDAEFLAVLLRRLDPAEITVVVGTGDAELPETASPEQLAAALERHCAVSECVAGEPDPLPTDPAAAFVTSDGTADDPRLVAAWSALDPARRAKLHDRRAAELEATGEPSVLLGAVPGIASTAATRAGLRGAAVRPGPLHRPGLLRRHRGLRRPRPRRDRLDA